MKSTHTGECQICGRVQKLPSGRLAKHGYTVEWSQFNGVCVGSDHLPFEQSKDEAVKRLDWAKLCRSGLEKQIDDLREGRATDADKAWVSIYDPRLGISIYGVRKIRLDSSDSEYHGVEYLHDEKIDLWKAVQGHGYFKTLEEARSHFNGWRADHLSSFDLRNIKRYIKWMGDRISSWKVKPLQEVRND